ncbi:MAG: site-specific integrase [Actinomycetota bacterium]
MGGSPSRVRVTGPLVPYAAGFRAELEAQGYLLHPVCDQLRVMAHVSRWLGAGGLGVGDLTPERVEEFLVARRKAGYVLWCSPKGVAPLLAHLRGVGAVPLPEPTIPTTPAEQLLEDFRAYLVEERGLAAATVASDLHVARLFLATRPQAGLGLADLSASEILDFVREECRHRSTGSARYVTAGLRAFLRFCHLTGHTSRPLADAVPKIASWRLAALPRALEPAAVAALPQSCDRRTTFGRRDFAALMLLSRLGLRAGEVAALRLEDVDWRQGELLIRGKGPKHERLPLPTDVGEAIASWLRRGRPRCEVREVFTRVRAPHRRLSTTGITAIVIAACKRAGIPEVSAHRLRHSAATQMLAAGAGLTEIGQVLRHRSVLTTAIYAKVDRSSLRSLAKPWPATDAGTVTR